MNVSIGPVSASDPLGVSVVPDATNLVVRYGSEASNVFHAPNKSTGGRAVLTNTSWKMILRAWL